MPKGGGRSLDFNALKAALGPETTQNALQKVVLIALNDASGDYEKAKKTIENWYDATMDRVSGWYVRRTGWWLLAIGMLSAAFFNVDAITVAHRLLSDDELRRAVVAAAATSPAVTAQTSDEASPGTDPSAALEGLTRSFAQIGFPTGWTWQELLPYPSPQACSRGDDALPCTYASPSIIAMPFGWLITGLAIMLGAPFWFDILDKFMSIRSTIKPKEKSPDAKPIDGTR